MSQLDVLIGLALYFVLACAALALVFLPAARALAWRQLRRLAATGRAAREASGRMRRLMEVVFVGMARAGRDISSALHAHRKAAALALAAILGSALLALALRGHVDVGAFDHTASHQVDERVAALLQGEQLLPPPALPPEVFTTPEVEQARPLVRFASRQWDLLDPEFRRRLLVVFQLLRERHGYEAVLIEGYRTPARQQQLAALGPATTQAGAFESYHQFGLAADIAFLRDNRVVISERDPWAMAGYRLLGETAGRVGLVWGGSWRSIQDYGHVELQRPGTLRRRGSADEPPSTLVH